MLSLVKTVTQLASFHLASDYHYVNQSDCLEIEGVSDSEVFQKTCKAMSVVGISNEKQGEIFKLLAAILHLGNWEKGE